MMGRKKTLNGFQLKQQRLQKEQNLLNTTKVSKYGKYCQKILGDLRTITDEIGIELEMDVCVLKYENGTYTIHLSNDVGFINLKPSPEPIMRLTENLIDLNNILIRKKYRGLGMGTKWLETIRDTLSKNDYGMILQPCCVDYCEETYLGNVRSLSFEGLSYLPDRVYHNYTKTLKEQIDRYENTPKTKRNKLYKENSYRLVDWYSQFGFHLIDNYMVYLTKRVMN